MHNTFVALLDELIRRLRAPFFNFTYWTHLLIGVFFYGAIGVWTEVVRRYLLHTATTSDNILLAMHTTYPAIIGATAMQLTLNRKEPTYVRSFAYLVSTMFVTMAALSSVAPGTLDKRVSFGLAAVGILSAAAFWWIANALDEDLKDVDPSAATGGSLPDEKTIASKYGASDHSTVMTPLGEVKL